MKENLKRKRARRAIERQIRIMIGSKEIKSGRILSVTSADGCHVVSIEAVPVNSNEPKRIDFRVEAGSESDNAACIQIDESVKHIISLGAGVQSSTMALMAARGEIEPMPCAAIFADTQCEPESVYRWLGWLETKLPFPVYRVTAGSLEKNVLEIRQTSDGRRYSRTEIPCFVRNVDGSHGKIKYRACTRDFKIMPLLKEQRRIASVPRGCRDVRVMSWIGISVDEVIRMKDSREPWVEHRWPLIEKRMTRADCLKWMADHGYPPPPRSACVFCPYHRDEEWVRLKTEEPQAFARAVKFEEQMQGAKCKSNNFRGIPFLHRSLTHLDQVAFDLDAESQPSRVWGEECEGLCGV